MGKKRKRKYWNTRKEVLVHFTSTVNLNMTLDFKKLSPKHEKNYFQNILVS